MAKVINKLPPISDYRLPIGKGTHKYSFDIEWLIASSSLTLIIRNRYPFDSDVHRTALSHPPS